ncbi:DUF1013 domain-containing protein [Alphaproteobacteria bacterium]|nr:DUF1013 domain-containing protein [Alphaproteobacteria bacterium]
MENKPLMPLATAVWLVDNTSLSFSQISKFCELHELEVQSIADGEEAYNMKGLNPIASGQLTKDEIHRCENDSVGELTIQKRKSQNIHIRSNTKKYLPLSIRSERPKAIAWLIREYGKILTDTQIAKLSSSTKPTVANIRAGNQSQPISEFRNPTDLGLCTHEELEKLVIKGQKKADRELKAKEKAKITIPSL